MKMALGGGEGRWSLLPSWWKWGGDGESLDQTLPHLPGEFSPAALNMPSFHHGGGGVGAAAEKGTGYNS